MDLLVERGTDIMTAHKRIPKQFERSSYFDEQLQSRQGELKAVVSRRVEDRLGCLYCEGRAAAFTCHKPRLQNASQWLDKPIVRNQVNHSVLLSVPGMW